jgi:glutaredoxin 2
MRFLYVYGFCPQSVKDEQVVGKHVWPLVIF